MIHQTQTTGTHSRRHFLASSSMGIGSLALSWLLNQDPLQAKNPAIRPELVNKHFDLKLKPTHHAPKAKAMISMFMQGGPSHLDMFDPKPMLQKYDGKKFPGDIKYDNAAQASSKVLGSPWKFSKHGECGTELSELVPGLSEVVDDIVLMRSMHTSVNNHGQSIYAMHSGRILPGRPTLGSWLTYGLGCESENLPAYIAMVDPGGAPVLGVDNWTNGWLPSLYQGTVIRPKEPRILNLNAPPHLSGNAQEKYLDFLGKLNQRHLNQHPGEDDLSARIASYELAAKMQTAATEALDLSKETKATQALYGIDVPESAEFGKRCLISRRLIERGVRFVQIMTGNQHWDHHTSMRTALPRTCKRVDVPSAGLVKDLKQRGLLDETLVHWGGEMGRLPVIQNDAGMAKQGRDHNTYGFTMWLAGGGLKGGMTYGATDEFGHHAVVDKVSPSDYHATLMHLFGIDAERLTFTRNGAEQSLIDKQLNRVVKEIIA